MRQQTIDFDALESTATEADQKPAPLTDSPTHPDYIRPDRQEIFADKFHFEWPQPHHDRDTITADRIHGSPDIGLTHRFTIKRGDTVKVSFGKDKFSVGQVIGISHAKQEVRIRYPESLGKSLWIQIAYVYPEPEPAPTEPTINDPVTMSEAIGQANAAHAPDDGFAAADMVHPPYAYDDFLEYLQLKEAGSATFTDYQTHLKRLSNSQDVITVELQERFNAKQLKGLASRFGDFYAKGNTKQKNATSIYLSMLRSFLLDNTVSFAVGEDYTTAIINKVNAVTKEDWNAHQQQETQREQEHQQAITDPQDLHDFRKFIDAHGEDALSNEQLARWDALHAELSRERYAKLEGPSSTVTAIDAETLGDAEFTLKEGYHQKRECKLWIVQLTERVEKNVYQTLLGKTRALGGWYSSFIKDQAGFQFVDADACLQFMNLLEGDVDRSEILENRKANKEQTAAERLHELAETIIKRSEETIESSAQSLQNTARRADIQLGVRGRAHAEAALARSLHSIAEALSTGEAKCLDGVRHMTQLQTLDTVLRLAKSYRLDALRKANDHRSNPELEQEENKPVGEEDIRHVRYPYPFVWKRNIEEAIEKCEHKRGLKQISARMKKRIHREANEHIVFTQEHDIKQLLGYIERVKRSGFNTQYLEDGTQHYNRLQRIGIRDILMLRAALREYLPHRSEARHDNPVVTAERELIGKKLPGFFPTPRTIIKQMIELADLQSGHRVLEPSCGKGDLLDALRELDYELAVYPIEQNQTLADVLSAKGYAVDFTNFLEYSGEHDRILMNPPFEKGQDIDHVRHAYAQLVPGGRLVAIMSEGPFFREDKKSVAFRQWLEEVDGTSERLPADTFKTTDAFRQTGVQTRLVTVGKSISPLPTSLTVYINLTENALPEISAESLHNLRWAIRDAIEERGIAEVIGSGNSAEQIDIGMEVTDVELAKTQVRAIAQDFGIPNVEFCT